MPPSLCSVCTTLNIEDVTSEYGFALHKNLIDLHSCANTCQLCSRAAKRICRGNSALENTNENQASLAKVQARVFYGQHVHHARLLSIVISDVNSQTPSRGKVLTWLLIRTHAGDPAESFGVKVAKLLPENNSSVVSTIHALQWLKECLSSKDCFEECSHDVDGELEQSLINADDLGDNLDTLSMSNKQNDSLDQKQHQRVQISENAKLLYQKRVLNQTDKTTKEEGPARLVEIINEEPNIKLRLVDGSTNCVPYVALSYRWGTLEAVWQTTTENMDSRRLQFSIDELPKTLSDTVQVTKDLGFRWLWIDSLCIIQNDRDDWAREAVKMASIYQNAIVTIAADSSKDAKAGLHNDKSVSMLDRDKSFEICNTLSIGKKSSIIVFAYQKTRVDSSVTKVRDMGDLLSHCSLRDRGWTMQERILSPRIIHYASDQLYWECYHGIQESEDMLRWMGKSSNITKMAYRVKSAKDGEVKAIELRKMLHYWYVLLVGGDYSHRTLTYGEDKLVAIGGVAKAFNEIAPLGYMVGHWGETDNELIRSLCWSRGSPGKKSPEYRSPSWSWASQDSAINYGHFDLIGALDDKIVAEPVAWGGQTLDDSVFGRCKSGYLQLKAKVAHGSVFPNCGHDFKDYSQAGTGGGYSVDPPKERCAFLMLEGGETSDLVWLDESQATQEPIREPISVRVVMLSEIRENGADPRPGACLVCTLDENYHLTRIGFTESFKLWEERNDEMAPPVTGSPICDTKAFEVILI
ncbi:related to tol protein [Fusarium torulosum]|uniref:Related to tol protein n=1 Tax=Fusarium torulosum TaxID=33205 RepID=A0AAE8M5T3_9HYPO|nr:related to tol protein [Fusarium torulosum]